MRKIKTINEASQSADWQQGYDDCIEAIRQALQGGGGGGGGGDSISDLENLPLTPPDGSQGGGNNGSDNEGQDIDVESTGSIGGYLTKEEGDKIAEEEGYAKEGGNNGSVEKEWEQQAKQVAKKIQQRGNSGSALEKFAAKLMNLNIQIVDWKRKLRKIVGACINNADTRRAYLHKNILISQDRPARTDKDKFDQMDTLAVFVDVSGSYIDQAVPAIIEAVKVALAKKPMRIIIGQWDTEVTQIDVYTDVNKLIRELKNMIKISGGGGTTAGCVWDWMEKNSKKYNFKGNPPELVMVFTDGYIEKPVPKRSPRLMRHLCWVIGDGNASFENDVPKERGTFVVNMPKVDANGNPVK